MIHRDTEMLFLRGGNICFVFGVDSTVGSRLLCCVYLFPPSGRESCATYARRGSASQTLGCLLLGKKVKRGEERG